MKKISGRHIVIGLVILTFGFILFASGIFRGNLSSQVISSPTTEAPVTTDSQKKDCVDKITREVRAYGIRDLASAFLAEVYPEHSEFPRNTTGSGVYALIQQNGATWAQNLLIEVRVRKCN